MVADFATPYLCQVLDVPLGRGGTRQGVSGMWSSFRWSLQRNCMVFFLVDSEFFSLGKNCSNSSGTSISLFGKFHDLLKMGPTYHLHLVVSFTKINSLKLTIVFAPKKWMVSKSGTSFFPRGFLPFSGANLLVSGANPAYDHRWCQRCVYHGHSYPWHSPGFSPGEQWKKGPFCCLGYMSGMKFPTQLCGDYIMNHLKGSIHGKYPFTQVFFRWRRWWQMRPTSREWTNISPTQREVRSENASTSKSADRGTKGK